MRRITLAISALALIALGACGTADRPEITGIENTSGVSREFLDAAQKTVKTERASLSASELVREGRAACEAINTDGGGRGVAVNLLGMHGYDEEVSGIISAATGTLC